MADDKRRSRRDNRGEDVERPVKERSHRGSRGDKDERSVKNKVEDKKVDTSAVDHKRSSTGSEDEILNGSNSNKKLRHEFGLEYEERKDVPSAVADLNGQHGPGVDSSLGGNEESAM